MGQVDRQLVDSDETSAPTRHQSGISLQLTASDSRLRRKRSVPPPLPAAALKRERTPEPELLQLADAFVQQERMPVRRSAPRFMHALGAGIGAGFFLSVGYALAAMSQPMVPRILASGPSLSAAPVTGPQAAVPAESAPLVVPVVPVVPALPMARPARETRAHLTPKRERTARSRVRSGDTSKADAVASDKHDPAATADSEALPAQPSRSQVRAAIERVRPELVRCVDGAHGFANAMLTIAGSGRVSHSTIDGTRS